MAEARWFGRAQAVGGENGELGLVSKRRLALAQYLKPKPTPPQTLLSARSPSLTGPV